MMVGSLDDARIRVCKHLRALALGMRM